MPDHNRSGMFTPVQVQPSAGTPAAEVDEGSSRTVSVVAPTASCVEVKEDDSNEVQIISDSDDNDLAASERAFSDSDKSDGLQSEVEEAVVQDQSKEVQGPAEDALQPAPGRMFFAHKKSGVCHVADSSETDGNRFVFFACGRKVSDNFTQLPTIGEACLKCSLCFKPLHTNRA